MEIQPKLLRLLQEREYERLGENVTRQADLRVIAATNRDLKKRMAEGAFREDLYFRLNVIAVEMPPLRARHGDLLRFAKHYLKHFSGQCGREVKGFSEEALEPDAAYCWPGNLRELRNAIERAVILAKHDQIERRICRWTCATGRAGAGRSAAGGFDFAGKAGGNAHSQGAGTDYQRGGGGENTGN